MARMAGAESSGAELRWELKRGALDDGSARGAGSSRTDANQSFVLPEEIQGGSTSRVSSAVALRDLDPELLATLSDKQQVHHS